MRFYTSHRNILWTVLFSILAALSLNACSDVSKAPAPPNSAPVANAGPDLAIIRGSLATLNGSASTDPNGDPLTYSWTLLTKPTGSTAVLANPTSVTANLYRRPRRRLCRATHCERWHREQCSRQRAHHHQQCRPGGQCRSGPRRYPRHSRHIKRQLQAPMPTGIRSPTAGRFSPSRPAAQRSWRIPPAYRQPLPSIAPATMSCNSL